MNKKIEEAQSALDDWERALRARREAFGVLSEKLKKFEGFAEINSVLADFEAAEQRCELAEKYVRKIANEIKSGLR